MRFAGLSEIRAYWEALRGGTGALPARAAFDPRGIERALPRAFLAAREADGQVRFRLAGQEICALAGLRDLRGTAPAALMRQQDGAGLMRLIDDVLEGPALAELDLDLWAEGRAAAGAARMLLLPMADTQGKARVVLGGLGMAAPRTLPPAPVATNAGLPTPQPLRLRSARLTRIDPPAGEPARAAGIETTTAQPEPQGMAEAHAAYTAQPAPPARHHLRVVK